MECAPGLTFLGVTGWHEKQAGVASIIKEGQKRRSK